MNKRVYIILILIILMCSCSTQKYCRLEIIVKEENEKYFNEGKVCFADILLISKDSNYKKQTDMNGTVIFDSILKGHYDYCITFLGYEKIKKTINIRRDTIINETLKEKSELKKLKNINIDLPYNVW